ncbi:WD40/YVTN/BNR-like repeat-containing protein [Streptomyces sp. GQFP]|uniref:WD40/YVTN/BNR-like repeat-containing protein n=1 Tax=Streptomyces sp. GQFP TaxID=2907545 RepID=UPI001F375992|nr:sialidase family protein [Streptomyces sp. GQFP]UIX31992.1 glycoside hydrolase [Streptomyces sp. GQFP]
MAEVLALAADQAGLWAGGPDGLSFLPYGGAPTATGWTAPVTALSVTDGQLLIGGVDTVARLGADAVARLGPDGSPVRQPPGGPGVFVTGVAPDPARRPGGPGMFATGVAPEPARGLGGPGVFVTGVAPDPARVPGGPGTFVTGVAPDPARRPGGPGLFVTGVAPEPARVPGGIGPVCAFAALSDGTLLAATLGDGVVRSTDGGRTWKRSGFGLASPEVSCLLPAADGTVLAGTAQGVHRARAGGRAWQPCPGSEDAPVAAVTQLPGSEALLAIAEDGRTLRSTDGGATWATAHGAPKGATALLPVDGGLLLATAEDGLHHSCDEGTRWHPLPLTSTVHCLATAARAVYAGTDAGVVTVALPIALPITLPPLLHATEKEQS